MFTDLSTPAVRSIAPSEDPASSGTRATLAGFFFVLVTAVTIGGVAAPFSAVDIATLAVTVPAGTPGTADGVVQFAGGTAITLPPAYGDSSPLPPRASGEVVAIPIRCRSRGRRRSRS
jgi:IPT/TIG domain